MANNDTVIPEDSVLAASDKPFVIAIVSVLIIVKMSMIYVLLKRRQDARRYAQQLAAEANETSVTMSTAPLAPDPMTQVFFNCSTASLETLGHNPPPAYTTKDQHLEFANDPPPPPFSANIPVASTSTSSSPEMSSSQTNENREESNPGEECPPVVVEVAPERSQEVAQT
ncbi:hypothetical protein BG000_011106, partial [Podila horticola]